MFSGTAEEIGPGHGGAGPVTSPGAEALQSPVCTSEGSKEGPHLCLGQPKEPLWEEAERNSSRGSRPRRRGDVGGRAERGGEHLEVPM